MAASLSLAKAIFSLQLLLFVSCTVSAQDTTSWTAAVPPAEPPTHHKGHRQHHKHQPPPTYPPTFPPHKPPVPPPTKPPVMPPAHPPVKPPAHPPVKPPVPPPVHPPVKPPVHPPVHPPVKPPVPPVHPPVKPPVPPVHPPVKPPVPPVHPPVKPPVPPVHPPVKPPVPPVHPPVKPPVHPPVARSFIAVQGVVYCKPTCQYAGVNTLLGADPLPGATVKLTCNNTRASVEVTGTTDNHGYFYVEAPKTITSFGIRSCRVKLLSSPSPKCPVPSALHRGDTGSRIRPEKPFVDPSKRPFMLFSVGPFAFEPKCKH